MYPFERFTLHAKRALSLAQVEAERAQQRYIGTEHLLLGLLGAEEGLAALALRNLSVELGRVRELIESRVRREERAAVTELIPTPRVKKVIEISFEEARRLGHNYVGTEHLLLGLLIQGEGIAADVLMELGADLPSVRAEIDRVLADRRREPPSPPPGRRPPVSAQLADFVATAGELAALEGADGVGTEHLLLAMAGPETRLAEHLATSGLADVFKRATETAQAVGEARQRKEEAINRQDQQAAAEHGAEEARLSVEFAQAMATWRRELGWS